jgi:hypothetical protein
MTVPLPFPKSTPTPIEQIDQILDLNREALLDAEKLATGPERDAKIAKIKGRINTALDERLVHMKRRDEGVAT